MTDAQPDPSTYEGAEGTRPAPPKPVRYEPHPVDNTPAPPPDAPSVVTGSPTIDQRLVAVSAPLATALFFVFGFAGGWAWSWLFFLIPPILHAWNKGSRPES